MKKIVFLTLSFLLFGFVMTSATTKQKPNQIRTSSAVEQVSDVKVYYFHGTHRCETCVAIEEVSQDALFEYYGSQGKIISINWEENEDDPIVQKYEVYGQSLLVVKDDQVVDLTNDAFLNALSDPEGLKGLIKSTIDGLD